MRQMFPFRKKTALLFWCLVSLISLSGSAIAYVLPGPFVLELMVSHFGKAKRLLVHQSLKIYRQELQNGHVELNETLKYIFPDKFRSDILSKNTHRIHVVSSVGLLTIIDGKVSADRSSRFDYYKDILLYHSPLMLQKRLSLLGVDLSVSSLGRFQGKIAYVLGAEYPDESVPQVWVEKETFMPLRWIVTVKTENEKDDLEIRYEQWAKKGNLRYPGRIVFYQNDLLLREIDVNQIQVDPRFSEKLFDIKHLRSTHSEATVFEPGKGDEVEDNEIKKTIEEFKKIYD